jgi:predicted nucleic acid-binding protein
LRKRVDISEMRVSGFFFTGFLTIYIDQPWPRRHQLRISLDAEIAAGVSRVRVADLVPLRGLYERLLLRPNITLVDYETPIIDLVKELLQYYEGSSALLMFMDALHLATAIRKGADAFYTFDSGGTGRR